jgi:hypothetical protein
MLVGSGEDGRGGGGKWSGEFVSREPINVSVSMVDPMNADVVALLGYRDYARVTEMYSLTRSDWPMAPSTE